MPILEMGRAQIFQQVENLLAGIKIWLTHVAFFYVYKVMKEAICIRTTPESSHFNCDGRYDIPDCWIATYRKLRGETRAGRTYPATS